MELRAKTIRWKIRLPPSVILTLLIMRVVKNKVTIQLTLFISKISYSFPLADNVTIHSNSVGMTVGVLGLNHLTFN